MNLCIAGLPVRIESADKAWFAGRFADYIREDDRPPVMEMTVRVLETVCPPAGETVQQVKSVTLLRLADGRLCRFGRDREGRVPFALYYTPDYACVELHLWAERRHPVFTLRDWEYMYTGMAFQNRLTVLGGGVLHSSSLAWRGHGVAFSANSGTGKSTHVGLWKQHLGDEVTVINDDKPAIRFEGDMPVLYGTPWSGKTALNQNVHVPLRTIVFIERGETNHLRRLDTMDSYCRLSEQLIRSYYDSELGVKVLDFTDKLLAAVPVYALTCNISREAVETAVRGLFPGEECVLL
ncbi:MAG: hypothetical protein IJ518_00275 [Clostridia bacterium]|nr:hypothetical protein [Clostridia bacterium]